MTFRVGPGCRLAAFVVATVLWLVLGAGTAGAHPDGPVPPDGEYFGLIALPVDEDGVVVPLRNGDATLGFAKACTTHNLCSSRVIVAAISGSGDKGVLGDKRVRYTGHVVGDGYDITVLVVAHTGRDTGRGDTPDGRAVGVITAYCEGVVRCPDAINTL